MLVPLHALNLLMQNVLFDMLHPPDEVLVRLRQSCVVTPPVGV